jgi:hypothetical protein
LISVGSLISLSSLISLGSLISLSTWITVNSHVVCLLPKARRGWTFILIGR